MYLIPVFQDNIPLDLHIPGTCHFDACSARQHGDRIVVDLHTARDFGDLIHGPCMDPDGGMLRVTTR